MRNPLEEKMMQQVGIALTAIDLFLLYGFIKSVIDDEEKVKVVFSSAEDCASIEGILKKIQRQFAPQLDKMSDDKNPLADILMNTRPGLILPDFTD